jgi:hypothetical protein
LKLSNEALDLADQFAADSGAQSQALAMALVRDSEAIRYTQQHLLSTAQVANVDSDGTIGFMPLSDPSAGPPPTSLIGRGQAFDGGDITLTVEHRAAPAMPKAWA